MHIKPLKGKIVFTLFTFQQLFKKVNYFCTDLVFMLEQTRNF